MPITKGQTYVELSASEITQTAIKLIQARNCYVWRQVNTSVRRRKGIVKKGVSDVLFFNRSTGLFGACEVKKLGDVLSDDQILFLTQVQISGAIALVATQVKDRAELIDFKEYFKD